MCAQNCVLLRRRRRRRRRLSVCRRRRQVETCVGSERVHECTDAFGFTISWIAAAAAWMSTNEWMRESNALYNLMRWWLVIILFVPSPVSDAGDKHESYKCVHVLFLQLAFWHLWYILINVSGRSVSGVSFRGECSDSQNRNTLFDAIPGWNGGRSWSTKPRWDAVRWLCESSNYTNLQKILHCKWTYNIFVLFSAIAMVSGRKVPNYSRFV